jgi:hypothetical protein
MAEHEIRTVTTLTNKRDELLRVIAGYERRLDQARADLSAIKAAIVVFDRHTEASEVTAYTDLTHLFQYGELASLCLAALSGGPLSTPAIAAKVAEAKGFDTQDKVLLKTITFRVVTTMRGLESRQKVKDGGSLKANGKRGRTRIWAIP